MTFDVIKLILFEKSKHDISQKILCIIVEKNLLKRRFDIFWKEKWLEYTGKSRIYNSETIGNINSSGVRFLCQSRK
jgi:hypothetical protein